MSAVLQLSLSLFLIVLSLVVLCGLMSVLVCWIHWLKDNKNEMGKNGK